MATLSVAVVGAGPAGATTARLLASRGAQVVLFEARRLPRTKDCAGGLTAKAQRLVPPGALATVERRIRDIEVRGGWLPSVHLEVPTPGIAMVERAAFDLALAQAAAAAGADVRDGVRVEALTEGDRGVTIATRHERLAVDVVVVADGDPSAMARHVGLGGPAERRSLAIDVDLPLSAALPADTAVLSFSVRGGYAWYFPKGSHASIGVGSSRTERDGPAGYRRLRAELDRFVAALGLDLGEGHVRGHWVPQGLRRWPLASRRALLVGDAAATCDPLLGEGISYAIISAVAASEAIAELEAGDLADLWPYDARMRALFEPPFLRLGLAAVAVERFEALALAALRLSPWVRGYAIDVVAGRRWPFAIDGDGAPGSRRQARQAYAVLRD